MKKLKEKRRQSIMAAVKKALKKAKVYLPPEVLQKLEATLQPGWYHIVVTPYGSDAEAALTCCQDCQHVEPKKVTWCDDFIDVVYGDAEAGTSVWYEEACGKQECNGCGDCKISYDYGRCISPTFGGAFALIKTEREREMYFGGSNSRTRERQTIFVYAPRGVTSDQV